MIQILETERNIAQEFKAKFEKRHHTEIPVVWERVEVLVDSIECV